MTYLKKYLPELVYGGIDGTVTTFAVVAGAVGAVLSPTVIIILGFANLFADGFSMAASNYLSRKSGGSPSKENKLPITTALSTFVAFIAVGFIPLISFVVAPLSPELDALKFKLSIALTVVAFIFVGAVRGKITGKNYFFTALETLIIGSVAALIAYGVGVFLRQMLG